uniref:substrate-binding periplasmic protein n=1 Tax=Pseudomonas laurentiana TaxID=2364649 RepID=UPI0029C8DE1F|nr:ABC transporter substrate-binding protein [Pseudomonas laurentiana]
MKLLFACLLSFSAFTAIAADLRMLTDNHPPLHFQQGGELVGFGVDVVHALAERTGDHVQMEQPPLLRALRAASTEPNTAVFTVLRTAEREPHYQWVGPLMEVETAMYARSDKVRPIRSLQEASIVGQIVLPRKWLAYGYLKEHGFSNLYGVETPEQMMKLLRLERADLVVADTFSIATLSHDAGLTPNELQYQFSFMRHGAYIAFSPQSDAHLVARWQKAFDDMNSDGSLQQLKQRWLIDHE